MSTPTNILSSTGLQLSGGPRFDLDSLELWIGLNDDLPKKFKVIYSTTGPDLLPEHRNSYKRVYTFDGYGNILRIAEPATSKTMEEIWEEFFTSLMNSQLLEGILE